MILLKPINPGLVEVYYGCMNSGKSMKLINRILEAERAEPGSYIGFKPSKDTRDPNVIKTRFGNVHEPISVPAINIPYDYPQAMLDFIQPHNKLVGIDEAHWFSPGLQQVVDTLIDNMMNVAMAGLNLDFKGDPYGSIPYFVLRPGYGHIEPCLAICDYKRTDGSGKVVEVCRDWAMYTQRLIKGMPAPRDSPVDMPGDKKGVDDPDISYGARCRRHFELPQ
jgi:thymidine kinase